eukprot:4636636-Alexandrium_andersonii.AAC.1
MRVAFLHVLDGTQAEYFKVRNLISIDNLGRIDCSSNFQNSGAACSSNFPISGVACSRTSGISGVACSGNFRIRHLREQTR